jgi:hypothetical protein
MAYYCGSLCFVPPKLWQYAFDFSSPKFIFSFWFLIPNTKTLKNQTPTNRRATGGALGFAQDRGGLLPANWKSRPRRRSCEVCAVLGSQRQLSSHKNAGARRCRSIVVVVSFWWRRRRSGCFQWGFAQERGARLGRIESLEISSRKRIFVGFCMCVQLETTYFVLWCICKARTIHLIHFIRSKCPFSVIASFACICLSKDRHGDGHGVVCVKFFAMPPGLASRVPRGTFWPKPMSGDA